MFRPDAAVPDWIDFPGAKQVAQIRRTVTTGEKKSVEVVYLITSAARRPRAAEPARELSSLVAAPFWAQRRVAWGTMGPWVRAPAGRARPA